MDEPKIPWGGIAKVTGTVAGVVGGFLTWLSWLEVRNEKRERARVHWTDAARWERR